MMKISVSNVLCIVLIFASVSCVNTKKAVYFLNQGEAELSSSNNVPRSVIQPSDLLSISVSGLSSQATNTFNTPNMAAVTSVGPSGTVTQGSGYLVNSDGYIKFPFLGRVKAAGITENELEDQITKTITERKLLLDPIVTVRHMNFKVTVLGEVNHPTVVNVPNEKITILEALGLAGDLTIFAKRDNILLIREENGKKITRRLNISSNELLNSPYYYLKSNDVVYVEPNKTKIASGTRSQQILPILFSALSFGIVVIDRIIK